MFQIDVSDWVLILILNLAQKYCNFSKYTNWGGWMCVLGKKQRKFHIYVKCFGNLHYFCGVKQQIKRKMKQATLKTIEQSDNVSLYSICFDGNAISEYEDFVQKFKSDATLNADYQNIILALEKIVAVGAFERFFRPEGKMSDRVQALSLDSRKLRLYCLRISDQILIVGNGGVKSTRTYQQDPTLSGYVMDLQKFDELLKEAQKTGDIKIEKNMIVGIDTKVFDL